MKPTDTPMRIVFMGTAEFAVPTLRAVSRAGHRILAAYTQPDRPAGRGLKVSLSPVKTTALGLGLEVLQPTSLSEVGALESLKELNPEVAVVVAYGLKLPPSFLSAPRLGCLNLHPSLLPKYRGAAPINWALMRGETRTGLSVIRMNNRMDAGDIVLQEEVEIGPEDNAGSLEAKLAELGAALMVRCLEELAAGRAIGRRQDEALATMAPKLSTQDLVINWNRRCLELRNMVRGLTPKPGARTFFRGKQLEVGAVRVISISDRDRAGSEPGMVTGCDSEDNPLVRASDGVLSLNLVKPEGKKMMSGGEFSRGYRPRAGERLG